MADEMARCNQSWPTKGTIFPNGTWDTSGDNTMRNLGIAIGIFDIILGSLGNFLTIVAILGNRKLRSTFHLFIVSLCCVDFCTATFMMPFNVVSYATETWPFGTEHITCSLQAYAYYCCGYSSIVCLLVITVNRYIGMLHHDKCEEMFSPRRIALTIFVSWIFAPAVMAAFFFIGKDGGPGYGWVEGYSLCVFRTDEDNQPLKIYMIFTRVLFQCVPLFVMIVLYGRIFYEVRKAGRTVVKRSLRSAECTSECTCEEPEISHENHTTMTSRNSRRPKSDLILSNMKSITFLRLENGYERGYHSDGSDALNDERSSIRPMLKSGKKTAQKTPFPMPNGLHQNGGHSINATETDDCSMTEEKIVSVATDDRDVRRTRSCPSRTAAKKLNGAPRYNAMQDTIRKRQRVDRRLLSISVTICLVFSIVFYPSVLVNLLPCSKYFSPNVHKCASIITWLNSCLNPIIYCFMNPKLRAEYKFLLYKFGSAISRLFGKDAKGTALRRSASYHRR